MDFHSSVSVSSGSPLQHVSAERVNQQRQSLYDESSANTGQGRHTRDSTVHEKVAQFNSMASKLKQAERGMHDAAMRRAQLGREEAESEMRRYREEAINLTRQVEELERQCAENKHRERKVGERLESVQENYGRAKETFAHTQAIWEKEIRRARKESFKSQSLVVKNQEEIKATRQTAKTLQAELEQAREGIQKREQEAFAARYQLVGAQEELSQLQEKMKLVEQERDALRTIAKNEEIARIAAEGQLPLPMTPGDDEFASPRKASKRGPVTIVSSAASEEELEEVRMLLQWEKQRADRAHDRVEFLEAECRLQCCESRADRSKSTSQKTQIDRPSTVFVPEEGVFKTLPPAAEEMPWISPAKKNPPPIFPQDYQPTPKQSYAETAAQQPTPSYARTPSCEPPARAEAHDVNISLLSLINGQQSPNQVEEDGPEAQADLTRESNSFHDAQESQEAYFHTISTTTRIPLANPDETTPPSDLKSSGDSALNPTMTREEALAQIRARRGRARSLAQGQSTPRKQMVEGLERRDISAPAIRSGNVRGRVAART